MQILKRPHPTERCLRNKLQTRGSSEETQPQRGGREGTLVSAWEMPGMPTPRARDPRPWREEEHWVEDVARKSLFLCFVLPPRSSLAPLSIFGSQDVLALQGGYVGQVLAPLEDGLREGDPS